jgi:hypothetical protein
MSSGLSQSSAARSGLAVCDGPIPRMRLRHHYSRLSLGRQVALRTLAAFLVTFAILRLTTAQWPPRSWLCTDSASRSGMRWFASRWGETAKKSAAMPNQSSPSGCRNRRLPSARKKSGNHEHTTPVPRNSIEDGSGIGTPSITDKETFGGNGGPGDVLRKIWPAVKLSRYVTFLRCMTDSCVRGFGQPGIHSRCSGTTDRACCAV